MTLYRDFATSNLKVEHFYANGSSGDDTNDGLTVSTPKATLDAVLALVPDVQQYNVAVHLAGTFNNQAPNVTFSRRSGYIVIDGGSDVTVVDDNSSSNYTTTDPETSTSSIGDSVSGSWTTDQHIGFWIEVLTGAAAGDIRLCYSNTSNTLVPTKNFSADPHPGTFRVVRPSTTFSGSTHIRLRLNGATLAFQNIYIQDTGRPVYSDGSNGGIYIANVIDNASGGTNPGMWDSAVFNVGQYYWNPSTFGISTANMGLSALSTTRTFWIKDIGLVHLSNCVIRSTIECLGSRISQFDTGNRFKKLVLQNSQGTYGADNDDFCNNGGTANQRSLKIDASADVGLLLRGVPFISMGANCDFSNNTSHGIQLENSTLRIRGAITGSGNGGAGIYAHTGSSILLKDGVTPTLTGTVGNIASSSATAEDITWSEVAAGTSLHIAEENTLVKEVA